jgi:hypothetical protein
MAGSTRHTSGAFGIAPRAASVVSYEVVPNGLPRQLHPKSTGKHALGRGSAEEKLQKRSLAHCASRSARPLPALPPVGRLGHVARGRWSERWRDAREVGAAVAHSPVESESASSPAARCRSARGLMAAWRRGERATPGPPPWPARELRVGRLHDRLGKLDGGAREARMRWEAAGAGDGAERRRGEVWRGESAGRRRAAPTCAMHVVESLRMDEDKGGRRCGGG